MIENDSRLEKTLAKESILQNENSLILEKLNPKGLIIFSLFVFLFTSFKK